jgi:hypothetical protein
VHVAFEIETAQMRDLVLNRRFGRGATIAKIADAFVLERRSADRRSASIARSNSLRFATNPARTSHAFSAAFFACSRALASRYSCSTVALRFNNLPPANAARTWTYKIMSLRAA